MGHEPDSFSANQSASARLLPAPSSRSSLDPGGTPEIPILFLLSNHEQCDVSYVFRPHPAQATLCETEDQKYRSRSITCGEH